MRAWFDRWRRRHAVRGSAAQMARWVVVDCETSGLDPRRDRLLSIGAVAVVEGRIRFEDSYAALLRQATASVPANILVHGITGTEQRAGSDTRQALDAFAAYAGPSPLVAYHAAFDRSMLARVAREAGAALAEGEWLDLAELLPIVFVDRARRCRSLDAWLESFSIAHPARHEAVGDAYATAQLMQIALAPAARQGLVRVGDLIGLGAQRKWAASGAT